jgi:hypothetical protein
MVFTANDEYQIHRVLMMMDACGRGRTDLVELDRDRNPINSRTGRPSFAHSQPEPMYSWNNVGPNNSVLGIQHGLDTPIGKLNIDYFNLGNGHTTVPADVKNFYNLARNGVQYSAPFRYPHPMTLVP